MLMEFPFSSWMRHLLLFPIFLSFTPTTAFPQNFPEPNPPKIEDPENVVVQPQGGLIPPSGTPTTEWTYHKSTDGSHPDGHEQQLMWLMNRARANPTAEGIWLATMTDPNVVNARDYFHVNLSLLQNEFAVIAAKPPAAFDIRLYNAARAHSEYLISIDGQNHTDQFTRIGDAGFDYTNCRGNVFSYAKTALYGHAGFNIDWGYSTDGSGMQDGRGHRLAIMSVDGAYSSVGMAAVAENNPATNVGPLVITGNYCRADTSTANHYNLFIVGTVWTDLDDDNIYDPGEGLAGIQVMPSEGTYYAITGQSGGYAIPLAAGGSYQVSFSGPGIDPGTSRNISVGSSSVLLDVEMSLQTHLPPKTSNTLPAILSLLLSN